MRCLNLGESWLLERCLRQAHFETLLAAGQVVLQPGWPPAALLLQPHQCAWRLPGFTRGQGLEEWQLRPTWGWLWWWDSPGAGQRFALTSWCILLTAAPLSASCPAPRPGALLLCPLCQGREQKGAQAYGDGHRGKPLTEIKLSLCPPEAECFWCPPEAECFWPSVPPWFQMLSYF